MTTIYVDPQAGKDTNDGLTTGTPVATIGRARTIIGANGEHSILIKSGSRYPVTSTESTRSGTSTTARFYLGIYDGEVPVTFFPATISITDLIWFLSGTQFVTVEDIIFDGQGTVVRPINIQTDTAAVTDIIFRNCHVQRSSIVGINLASNDTANWPITYITFENCSSIFNGGHGIVARGEVNNITYRNCLFDKNSLTRAEHGASSFASRTTITSGWADQGSNVWRIAISPASKTVLAVVTSNSTYPRLTDAGAGINPTAGQFKQDSGFLYANIGTTLNGLSVSYSYTRMEYLTYETCIFSNTSSTDLVEGTGMQFDDFTSFSTVRSCIAYGNYGVGFVSNAGTNNRFESNIAFGNGRRGFNVQKGGNHTLINNTSIFNNLKPTDNSEMSVSSMAINTTVTNNLVQAFPYILYGIQCDTTSASGSTASNNAVSGQSSTAVQGLTDSNLVTSVPTLNSAFMPTSVNVRAAGATALGSDFYNYPRNTTPTIGAVQYHPNGTQSITATQSFTKTQSFTLAQRFI